MRTLFGPAVIILLLLKHGACAQDCALPKYDSIFIESYFVKTVSNIRSHLAPTLSDAERKILSQTTIKLGSDSDRDYVRSYSHNRTILIGRSFIQQLVQHRIARIIEEDSRLDRKHVSGLFSEVFFYINPKVSAWKFSGLNCKQTVLLKTDLQNDCFYGQIIENLSFVIYHEFYHQIQNYDNQIAKISNLKDEKAEQSQRAALELQADQFAISKLVETGLCPAASGDCLAMLSFFESYNSVGYDFANSRRYLAYKYIREQSNCKVGLDLCKNECKASLVTCDDLSKLYIGSKILYDNALETNKVASARAKPTTAYATSNIADFYLKGTDYYRNDLKLAISHYEYLAKINPSSHNLYGARDVKQLTDFVEYSRLVLGLIYQFRCGELNKARLYYISAASLGKFLSANHYQSLINGCK